MHNVNIHIDELLPAARMQELREELMEDPRIHYVDLHRGMPHDMQVECDDHQNVPMQVLARLHEHGIHADIVGC